MKLVLLAFMASAMARSSMQWIMDNPSPTNLLTAGSQPSARFVTQPQDHFDTANGNTWQQAYYVNDSFWTPGSDAPIFLCVGGEGPPLDGSAVTSSVHCNVAVEWLSSKKACMFALEHRYYGCHNMSACPVKSFEHETESLKYLSSRQAVEDVAGFVRQMNTLFGFGSRNKWVTWGGSYPGMLAGWSRLRHPELIHAAVASSAPVYAKLDMFEYNDAVAHAYIVEDNGVGGSLECRDSIRKGHRIIEDALRRKGGSATVEEMIGLSNGSLATKEAQRDYLGNGMADFPAQGNDPACSEKACNIKKICEIMLDASHGDELQRLLVLRKAQASTGLLKPQDSIPDYWFYQTCTEFGFYQSCEEKSSCMFVRGLVDVASEAEGCAQYGIKIADIEYHINSTNSHYGGLTPVSASGHLGSCVVWPNGEVDPWASLSVLKSLGESQPALWVPGASHHAWTHPVAPADQPSVVTARSAIRAQVETFLAQDCRETTSQVIMM